MRLELFDLRPQHELLNVELRRAFDRVVRSGAFILGDEVASFERACTEYLGSKYSVGLSSGSDALYLALKALDIGPGDEVITTPFTFIATAEAIVRAGATPVFADIRPSDFCLCPESTSRLISARTRAILYVHLYGKTGSIREQLNLCKSHDVYLIEDACQAFGAQTEGRFAGTFGDIGCFSFFPTKPLGGLGDGGLCVTDRPELEQRLRQLRTHGFNTAQLSDSVAGNFRLDALQAALLSAKLPYVDTFRQTRAAIADSYHAALGQLGSVVTPMTPDRQAKSAWSLYTVSVSANREGLKRHLATAGIDSRVYYPTLLPDHPSLAHRCRRGDLTQAHRATETVLSIPIYYGLDEEQRTHIAASIVNWCEQSTARRASHA
ncbi:MAG TPA: DegT/DnrJ/EryC1/StrS family aminotransferase [Polyangiaceae bacterium]